MSARQWNCAFASKPLEPLVVTLEATHSGLTPQAPGQTVIDLAKLKASPLAREPFDHFIVPGFVPAEALAAIERDFPTIEDGGSHPAFTLKCGPAMKALIDAVRGREMAEAVGEKFDLELTQKATMVTLRGQCRAKDGQIHTDSKSKVVTALIYLNRDWGADGGRLRLLKQSKDIEDFVVEVPPDAGTLLVFRCTPTAWHGHKPFVGERRSLQLNWVVSHGVARREQARHALSHAVGSLTHLFKRRSR